jgi:hypothetical protein
MGLFFIEAAAMADNERFESLAGVEQDVQITERTKQCNGELF